MPSSSSAEIASKREAEIVNANNNTPSLASQCI